MALVSTRKWASGASIASGVAMAALPKCPACLAAYFGFLSAFGIDRWAPDYLAPLTTVLFGVALVFLGYRAWRGAEYGPWVLAIAGAAILVTARMLDGSTTAVWIGFGFFFVGAVWSARQPHESNAAPCHSTRAEEAWA